MTSFIEILKCEMQSPAFIDILDRVLPLRSQDEQEDVIKEILELVNQNTEIRDYCTMIESERNTMMQQAEFQEVARLALEYLKQFVQHIANKQIMVANNQDDVQERSYQSSVVSEVDADDDDDELNFSLSTMRPEDEFMLEDESYESDASDQEVDLEQSNQSQSSLSIEDVWMLVVRNAMNSEKTKSAGAA